MIPRLIQISQILSLMLNRTTHTELVLPKTGISSNMLDSYEALGFVKSEAKSKDEDDEDQDLDSNQSIISLTAKDLIRIPKYHLQHSFVKYRVPLIGLPSPTLGDAKKGVSLFLQLQDAIRMVITNWKFYPMIVPNGKGKCPSAQMMYRALTQGQDGAFFGQKDPEGFLPYVMRTHIATRLSFDSILHAFVKVKISSMESPNTLVSETVMELLSCVSIEVGTTWKRSACFAGDLHKCHLICHRCKSKMHSGQYDAATLLGLAPGIIAQHYHIGPADWDKDLLQCLIGESGDDEYLNQPSHILFSSKKAMARYIDNYVQMGSMKPITEKCKIGNGSLPKKDKNHERSAEDRDSCSRFVDALKMDHSSSDPNRHYQMLLNTQIFVFGMFEYFVPCLSMYKDQIKKGKMILVMTLWFI